VPCWMCRDRGVVSSQWRTRHLHPQPPHLPRRTLQSPAPEFLHAGGCGKSQKHLQICSFCKQTACCSVANLTALCRSLMQTMDASALEPPSEAHAPIFAAASPYLQRDSMSCDAARASCAALRDGCAVQPCSQVVADTASSLVSSHASQAAHRHDEVTAVAAAGATCAASGGYGRVTFSGACGLLRSVRQQMQGTEGANAPSTPTRFAGRPPSRRQRLACSAQLSDKLRTASSWCQGQQPQVSDAAAQRTVGTPFNGGAAAASAVQLSPQDPSVASAKRSRSHFASAPRAPASGRREGTSRASAGQRVDTAGASASQTPTSLFNPPVQPGPAPLCAAAARRCKKWRLMPTRTGHAAQAAGGVSTQPGRPSPFMVEPQAWLPAPSRACAASPGVSCALPPCQPASAHSCCYAHPCRCQTRTAASCLLTKSSLRR
jgi:hypothetical protein